MYDLLNRFPENKSGYFTFTGKRLGLLVVSANAHTCLKCFTTN